jgi:hypothetical protein
VSLAVEASGALPYIVISSPAGERRFIPERLATRRADKFRKRAERAAKEAERQYQENVRLRALMRDDRQAAHDRYVHIMRLVRRSLSPTYDPEVRAALTELSRMFDEQGY